MGKKSKKEFKQSNKFKYPKSSSKKKAKKKKNKSKDNQQVDSLELSNKEYNKEILNDETRDTKYKKRNWKDYTESIGEENKEFYNIKRKKSELQNNYEKNINFDYKNCQNNPPENENEKRIYKKIYQFL